MSKITLTSSDGSVTELTEAQYDEMLQKTVSAILASPVFETKLQAVMDKVGDAVVNRLGEVEKTVKEQGEKLLALETRVTGQDARFQSNEDKSQALGRIVEGLRKKVEDGDKEKNRELSALRRRVDELEQGAASVVPSSLDSCPDPGNLRDDFKRMLQVKKNNSKQLIFGPVLSKTPGDGFLDKDNLTPLTEEEIDEAIRATETEGTFIITIANAEKRIAKVRFEGESAAASCEKIITSWRTLRDDFQMWAGPDQPVDLARMEANAKKFGIELRNGAKLPSNSYVTVTDGVLFIGEIRVAPVYVIPEPAKWPLVNPIVLNEIKTFLSLPWTARKVRGSSIDMVSKIWDAVWKDVAP
jgi:hypothetical protein